MSLKAKRKPANNIPPVDGGTYMAVCIGVIDLGEQYRQFEKQKQGRYVNECMFLFEIPSERSAGRWRGPSPDGCPPNV